MSEISTERNRPKGLLNRYFILVVCISTFMGAYQSLFNSSNALHVEFLGGTTSQRGIMLAALPCAALLTRIFIGRTIELHGRRILWILGLSFTLIMVIGYMSSDNIKVLILFRFLQGIGFCATQTCCSVAITDLVDRKRLGEGLSVYALFNQICNAVMPSISLYFTSRLLFKPLFALAAGLLCLAILSAFLCTYEKKYPGITDGASDASTLAADPESGYREDKPLTKVWLFLEKRALIPTLVTLLFSIGGSCTVNYLLLYAGTISIAKAGLFYTLQAICMFCCRAISSRSIDKFGAFKVFLPGSIISIAAFIMLTFSDSIPVFYYLAGAFYGFGNGLVHPSMNTAAIRSCPEERRSVASSTYMLSSDVGMGTGGFIMSFVIGLGGYRTMFLCSTGFFVIALAIAIYYFKVRMKGVKL